MIDETDEEFDPKIFTDKVVEHYVREGVKRVVEDLPVVPGMCGVVAAIMDMILASTPDDKRALALADSIAIDLKKNLRRALKSRKDTRH